MARNKRLPALLFRNRPDLKPAQASELAGPRPSIYPVNQMLNSLL